MTNLNFNTEYSVQIRENNRFTTFPNLNGVFLSLSCAQIYGIGSLECGKLKIIRYKNLFILRTGTTKKSARYNKSGKWKCIGALGNGCGYGQNFML